MDATALKLCHNIRTHETLMNKSMERLSSGKKLNKAADDPAGLCISEGMEAQIRGMNAAEKNVQDAVSLIQTADDSLDNVQSILQDLNELAVKSATATCSKEDRENNNIVFKSLVKGVNDILKQSQFNTRQLFGKNEKLNIQIGANYGQVMKLDMYKIDSKMLGLEDLDISTEEGASKAINDVKEAINIISKSRSSYGASAKRLDYIADNLEDSVANLTEAKSRITDADMAKEMITYTREKMLTEVSTCMLGNYLRDQQGMVDTLLMIGFGYTNPMFYRCSVFVIY